MCVNEYANVISNAITEQAALLNTSLKDNKQQRIHDSNTTGVVYMQHRSLTVTAARHSIFDIQPPVAEPGVEGIIFGVTLNNVTPPNIF